MVALVAVTVTWKVPCGVGGVPVCPPHPSSASTSSSPARAKAQRRRIAFFFLPLSTNSTNPAKPSSGNTAAYKTSGVLPGSDGGILSGPNRNTEPDPADAMIPSVTVAES